MGAPVIRDKSQVVRWVREGLTNEQIVRRLADEGVHITPQAISNFRRRHSLPNLRPWGNALIPWTLEPQHRNLWPAKMLRSEAAMRRGAEVPDGIQRSLERWKQRLADDDTVVHYEPLLPEGWLFVPRRQGIDTDLIRVPEQSKAASNS